MEPLTALAVGLGGASIVGNMLNFGLGVENYNYQKRLQHAIFAREDTSIARRVADLRASGMSPVLAAGQGAGTGAVVNTSPPSLGDMTPAALNAMALLKQDADISRTKSEDALIKQQERKSLKEMDVLDKQMRQIDASTAKLYADKKAVELKTLMDAHDYDIARGTGMTVKADGFAGMLKNFAASGDKTLKKWTKIAQDDLNKNVMELRNKAKEYKRIKSDKKTDRQFKTSIKKYGSVML